jgi:4-amino-4-deoxy-L-arabinose transferase-like glycosyltransferase
MSTSPKRTRKSTGATEPKRAKPVSGDGPRKKQRAPSHTTNETEVQAPLGFVFTLACAGLGALYVSALIATARAIGYSRDESFYFDAARRYAHWYLDLFQHAESALSQASVDNYFSINHEHPPLMKTLFGLSHHLFERCHWLAYEGLSFRLPAMVIAGTCVTLVALWGARNLSRSAGVVAALCLAFMPRFFHHAHLACFDVPVAGMCLASAFAWSKALDSGKFRWALLLGLVYGLTLATKHNAWLLPPAFLLHAVMVKGRSFWRGTGRTRMQLLLPFASLTLIAPLVLCALWPWLWYDTWERLGFWFQFHAKHEYYNMEFLGSTYWKPPMPLGYAWVMTVATVPLTTLLLFVLGGLCGTRSVAASLPRAHTTTTVPKLRSRITTDFVLWVICIVTFYSPWLSSETPIFGGTKHWMTAYPFLALVAGLGFHTLAQKLPLVVTRWSALNQLGVAKAVLAVLLIAPSAVMVKDMGPWGLSTYTPLVGGASGAASLGLNRTFWGYTTLALAPELSAHAPGRVYLHDMTGGAWDMHQRDGTLPRNLYGVASIVESDLALYHHEPHMERVEYQIWSVYGSSTPTGIGTCEGVPVVWFFNRRTGR